MGKKLAIGCGIVFALLFVAGGVVAWWFIGRPAGTLLGTVRDVQRIESIRDGIRDTSSYQPPADRVLAEDQVDRWLVVQETMRAELEGRAAELQDRYEELDESGRDPNPQELAQAARDLTGLLVDATRAQVDALNAQGFSLEEYRWVRARVLEAAGFAAAGYDVTDLAGGDDAPRIDPEPGASVPPENVERVTPHRDRIEENLAFAWFGL